MRDSQVVVIGSSDSTEYLEEAYLIGRYIAQNGYILISGGRSGIMEAVSKGAREKNGTVIGILPGDDIGGANKYCNIVIPTGIGYARNIINILSADIIIAIGGKSGTLSELAFAWQYKKPIICCTFAKGWSKEFPKTTVDNRNGSIIYTAGSLEDVYRYLKEFISSLKK